MNNGIIRQVGTHAKILLVGMARALYGAATAVLVGLAVYGFSAIPAEGGYTAVLEFVGAIATLAVALCSMYTMGRGKKKQAGRYAANG